MTRSSEPEAPAAAASQPAMQVCPRGRPRPSSACQSRVTPRQPDASYLIATLDDVLPCPSHAMPLDDAGNWAPLSLCDRQLIAQWVASGANP